MAGNEASCACLAVTYRPHEIELVREVACLRAEMEAAGKLSHIYFQIASEAIGEDAVREKRDAAIAALYERSEA